MSRRKFPRIYKENGIRQRQDTALTKIIAGALMRSVLLGESLYPPSGQIQLDIGEENPLILSTNTLKAWIQRDNVIPETGQTLRGVLDQARADYRTRKREEKQEQIIDMAETKLTRVLSLRTSQPLYDKLGRPIQNEDGSIARKENIDLLKAQIDVAKYVTERLDPARYGKTEKGEHKHLVFSLAELRRYKEERDRQRETQNLP